MHGPRRGAASADSRQTLWDLQFATKRRWQKNLHYASKFPTVQRTRINPVLQRSPSHRSVGGLRDSGNAGWGGSILVTTPKTMCAMKPTTPGFRSHCPVNFALEMFGDKWSLLILRDLIFMGKRYFGQFLKSREGIATNILADRLDKLETRGIIAREVDAENRSKIRYSATDKGLDLIPILLEMNLWSGKYDGETEVPQAILARIRSDREGYIRELRRRHRG